MDKEIIIDILRSCISNYDFRVGNHKCKLNYSPFDGIKLCFIDDRIQRNYEYNMVKDKHIDWDDRDLSVPMNMTTERKRIINDPVIVSSQVTKYVVNIPKKLIATSVKGTAISRYVNEYTVVNEYSEQRIDYDSTIEEFERNFKIFEKEVHKKYNDNTELIKTLKYKEV